MARGRRKGDDEGVTLEVVSVTSSDKIVLVVTRGLGRSRDDRILQTWTVRKLATAHPLRLLSLRSSLYFIDFHSVHSLTAVRFPAFNPPLFPSCIPFTRCPSFIFLCQ